MYQFVSDFWARLDWPNIIAPLVIGPLAALIYIKGISPLWVKYRSTSKLILDKRKKSQILRDWKRVIKLRTEPNTLFIWGLNKVLNLVIDFLVLILCSVFMTGVVASDKLKNELVGTFGSEGIFTATMAAVLGIVGAAFLTEAREWKRLTKYINDFPEFKKQASAILTKEEMENLEGVEAFRRFLE